MKTNPQHKLILVWDIRIYSSKNK